MSGELTPYVGGALTRDSRRAGRSISRIQSGSQVRLAAVDAETEATIAKIDAVTTSTGMAMNAVARVGQVQAAFEASNPSLSGRLNFLAESHLMAMDGVLQDLRCQLRRR